MHYNIPLMCCQFFYKTQSALWVAVSPVSKGMHYHIGNIVFLGQGAEFFKVIDMGVYPSIAHQAHKMQCSARYLSSSKSSFQHRTALKFPIFYGYIDTFQFLVHNSACAYIEVPDFTVAHLPFGQTNSLTAGYEFRIGVSAI